MLPQRSMRWIIWSSVVLTACSVLFFRCFLSLDGPMHVLHAGALGDAVFGKGVSGEGVFYDLSGLDKCLLDPFVYLLLHWAAPEVGETCLAALVLFVFLTGAVVYARALIGEHRWGVVLVLPLSVNYLFVLGFFPFLFGVGICLWFMGRWLHTVRITYPTLLLLVLTVVACLFVHRGALPLLGFLLLVHEGAALVADPAAFKARWSVVPRWLPLTVIAVGALALTAHVVQLVYLRAVFEHAPARYASDLLRLRPWLLVHDEAERVMRMCLGVLLLSLCGGAAVRARRSGASIAQYAPLFGGACLIIAGLVIQTPWTALHYVMERAQVVGAVLLVIWSAAMIPNARWMGLWAVLVLSLHGCRTFYLEHRLAYYEPIRASAAQASAQLAPGSLVAAELTTNDWLLQHCLAPVMVRHTGVVVSRHDKLPVSRSTISGQRLRQLLRSHKGALPWIEQCNKDPQCPQPRHVLLFGDDPTVWLARYPQVGTDLRRDYTITASTKYWMVWTRK